MVGHSKPENSLQQNPGTKLAAGSTPRPRRAAMGRQSGGVRAVAAAGVLLALLAVLPAALGGEDGHRLTTVPGSGPGARHSSAGQGILLSATAGAAHASARRQATRRSMATGNLSSSQERACPGDSIDVAWRFDPGMDVALQLWLAGPGDGSEGLGSIAGTAFLAQVGLVSPFSLSPTEY